MSSTEVHRIVLRDGREAEEKVVIGDDGTKVTELYAEPVIPKHLESRVVEKSKPIVYERTIETVKDGKVVDTKIESLEPEVKMEIRRHIVDDYVSSKDLDEGPADQQEIRSMAPQQPKRSLRMEVADRVESQKKEKFWVWAGLAVIAAQLGALVYVIFLL